MRKIRSSTCQLVLTTSCLLWTVVVAYWLRGRLITEIRKVPGSNLVATSLFFLRIFGSKICFESMHWSVVLPKESYLSIHRLSVRAKYLGWLIHAPLNLNPTKYLSSGSVSSRNFCPAKIRTGCTSSRRTCSGRRARSTSTCCRPSSLASDSSPGRKMVRSLASYLLNASHRLHPFFLKWEEMVVEGGIKKTFWLKLGPCGMSRGWFN